MLAEMDKNLSLTALEGGRQWRGKEGRGRKERKIDKKGEKERDT